MARKPAPIPPPTGADLRALRTELEMNQADFAALYFGKQSGLSRYESDRPMMYSLWILLLLRLQMVYLNGDGEVVRYRENRLWRVIK